MLHYLTRFLDGLTPAIRISVSIQQPSDLQTAYHLALSHEELGDGSTPGPYVAPAPLPHDGRDQPLPLPPPARPHTAPKGGRQTSEDINSVELS
jgi:hypothetical protein